MTNEEIFSKLRKGFAVDIAKNIKAETKPTEKKPYFSRELLDDKISSIEDSIIRNLVDRKLAGFFHADYEPMF